MELQSRTPAGEEGPLYVPDVPNNTEGPQARELCKCLNAGRAMEKDWPKRPSDCQLQEAQKKKKKDSDSAITSVALSQK